MTRSGAKARPDTTTYPNGQTTTYSYFLNSGDQRLQTIHHQRADGLTISKFDYTYDTRPYWRSRVALVKVPIRSASNGGCATAAWKCSPSRMASSSWADG